MIPISSTTPDQQLPHTSSAAHRRTKTVALFAVVGLALFFSIYSTARSLISNSQKASNPSVLGTTTPDSQLALGATGIPKDGSNNYLFPLGSVDVLASFSTGSLNPVESIEAIIHYDPLVLSAASVDFNQSLSTQYLKFDALKCNPVYIQKDSSGKETGTIRIARTAVPLPTTCPPAMPPADPVGSPFPSYMPIPVGTTGNFALIKFTSLQHTTTPSLISYEYQITYPNPKDALNDSNAPAYLGSAGGSTAAYDTLSKVTNLSFLVPPPQPTPSPSPADTTPPTVQLTNPVSGNILSGTVDATATANDANGIAKVMFFVDGSEKCTDTSAPYTCSINTSIYSNGSSHTIDAQAFDTATPSNSAIDGASVVICNGDCQDPTAPTNLKVTSALYNSISLSWTPSTDDKGVVGYYVYRRKTTDPTYWQIASVNTASFTDSNVSSSTSYVYAVKAFDAQNNFSKESNEVTAVTPAQPVADTTAPSAPAGVAALASSTSQINLTWTASADNVGGSGMSGYNVYGKKTSDATFTKLNSTLIASTTFGNTGLATATQYSYYITAVDKSGNESVASATVAATTMGNVVSKGNISGKVTAFSNQASLSGVKVTATMGTTKITTYTDSAGKYSFLNMAPGVYTLSFRMVKYESIFSTANVVSGQTVFVNVPLKAK